MNHSDAARVSQLDAETRAVEAAIREATHEAVLAHKPSDCRWPLGKTAK